MERDEGMEAPNPLHRVAHEIDALPLAVETVDIGLRDDPGDVAVSTDNASLQNGNCLAS